MSGDRYSTGVGIGGNRLQSGIPKGDPKNSPLRANGLTLQGVVVAVYPYDANAGPSQTEIGVQQNAAYCDVLCYGRFEGVIPRVLVTHGERQGLNEGDADLPHPATIGVDQELDTLATNPTSMDGDHVIVGFLEDMLNRPYLLRYLTHPSSDAKNVDRKPGHRLRLRQVDGENALTKKKGAVYGVDRNGNYILDLVRAYGGGYEADGSEPTPALVGTNGNYSVRIPENSSLTVEVTKGVKEGKATDDASESTLLFLENNKLTVLNTGGAGLLVEGKDGAATIAVGDGAVHSAVAEHLHDLWDELVAWLTKATVLTAVGTSAPLPTTSGPPPSWDNAIQSSKSSFPDG